MTITLLGPQRFTPSLGATFRSLDAGHGPVATVTAGWQEREGEDDELNAVLDGRGRNLSLYRRWLHVLESDPTYAAADRALRDELDDLRRLYDIRLDHALQALDAVDRLDTSTRLHELTVQDAIEQVRRLDAWHLGSVAAARASWSDRADPLADVVRRHQHEVAEQLDECSMIAIAGGQVAVLLECLRLFAVGFPPGRAVVAWSAGAMVLADRVVLVHDMASPGSARTRHGHAQVYDAGLGVVPGVVPLPHARRRLPLRDAARTALLARRFAPAHCLVLDDGVRIDIGPDGSLPAGARLLNDGGPAVVGWRPPEPDRHNDGAQRVRQRTKLAINRLRERRPLDGAMVERFLSRHDVPIVEGDRCTFLFRGAADEVWVRHGVLGLPHQPLRRIGSTDLWYVVVELPSRSRVEYQIEIRQGDAWHRFNDPLNPRVARSPVGDSSVCYAAGYEVPEWTRYDPEARPGQLVELSVQSQALRRDCKVVLYLPARYQPAARYPLLIVHDGSDFLEYADAKAVLDNLIHRLDVAELVAAFLFPGNRLVEYANSAAHARFVTAELLPELESQLPLASRPSGRCLLGSSFGAVAALSTAARTPEKYGSLFLQSGSFVHTDIGVEHGGGPVFDPVVRFVNRYRERPRPVADRIFQTCGVYEPLVVPNRSMATTFRETGMDVRYVEARDGHNWENWRDRWREGLSWIFPGPQKFVYE